jgi:hypothetical protein
VLLFQRERGERSPPMQQLREERCKPKWVLFESFLANFYEKALFVKADVAASSRPSATAGALRAMLLSALSGSSRSLRWLGALWDPSFRAKGAAIFRAVSPHARGRTKFARAVTSLDPKRNRATAVEPRHAASVLGSSPLYHDRHLLFTHSLRSFASLL